MAVNGSDSNTQGAARVVFTFAGKIEGDCLPDKIAEEIERRLRGEVMLSDITVGAVFRGASPPNDTTLLWQKTDPATGFPIGQIQRYNAETGQWGDMVASVESVCISGSDENVLEQDASGCWLMREKRCETLTYKPTEDGTLQGSWTDPFTAPEDFTVASVLPANDDAATVHWHVAAKTADSLTLGFSNVVGAPEFEVRICEIR